MAPSRTKPLVIDRIPLARILQLRLGVLATFFAVGVQPGSPIKSKVGKENS